MPATPVEPALLLHGQPGGASDWDRVQVQVGERLPIIAIDRPGWAPGTSAVDLAGNADAALDALDRAGAARATVVGFSFGAAVAAWLAAEHPERVSRLVLAAPALTRASLVPLDHWLARPVAGELVSIPLLGGLGATLSLAPVRAGIARLTGLEERYLAAMAAAIRGPGAWLSFAAEQRVLVRDLPALEARLSTITAPTTVLIGSADRVVSPASAQAAAEVIPGAAFVVLEGAGHLLLQRRAADVAEVIVAPPPRRAPGDGPPSG